MKKTILSLMLCVFAFAAKAQNAPDEVTVLQGMYGMEKRALIAQLMDVKDPMSQQFWTVYDQFEQARKKLGQERIQLLADYASNYTMLDDKKVDAMAKDMLANNVALEKLYKKYYGKMSKATSPMVAAQWMQVEMYLQTAMRSEVQNRMPFIAELRTMQH